MPVEFWHITPSGQVRRCKVNIPGSREWQSIFAGDDGPYELYQCALTHKKAIRIRDSMIEDYRVWRGPRVSSRGKKR